MASSTRRLVSELGHKEPVEQIFLASEKQLRPNRNGNLYLQVELSDRSGSVCGLMWNASDNDYRAFENGDYVHVEGSSQLYQGNMQLIVSEIRRAGTSEVDEADFLTLTAADVDKLAARLAEMLRDLTQPPLRDLAECFLMDEALMQRMLRAPAGMKNHHAYRGGLLEHVVNMMEVALRIADRFPQVDNELLQIGCFLHDIGKIEELAYEQEYGYTDDGQLLGHILLGVDLLERKIRETERLTGDPFPEDTARRLKHMIASHHGAYEFGAPKLPMTLEAIALHYIDNLDAKIHSFEQLLRSDANFDSPWTHYHANLGRKLYKGRSEGEIAT